MQESTVVVIGVIDDDDDGVRVQAVLFLLLLLSLLYKIGRAGKERESAIVFVVVERMDDG